MGSTERAVVYAGAGIAVLIAVGLAAAFYHEFRTDRLTFWIWLAALAVLISGDALFSRITGVTSLTRMTKFYQEGGLPSPRTRARIVVVIARLGMPTIILSVMLVEWAFYSAPK